MATHTKFSSKKQAKQSRTSLDGDSPDSHSVVKPQTVENPEEFEKLIWFWRSHIDVFIEDYLSTPEKPIKLFDVQKVVARNAGNVNELIDVEARSLGKTWKMGLILSALSILYSDNRTMIVSATVNQSIITARYIETMANSNENLRKEIILPIKISKDGALITFKNGSTIIARAMARDGSNLRGNRAKILFVDESLLVKSDVIQNVLMPILQYKRDIYWAKKDEGFEDFESKLFETSSAYLKSCDFFARFKNNLSQMKKGNLDKFACALNYKTGIRLGIIDEKFVENQRLQMPLSAFQMEWNAFFVGNVNGSLFPYDITEPCRDLERVELVQPKGSHSRYVMAMDVATSASSWADNACLTIIKISEKADHTFHKNLVFMRTYHGYKLEALALEIRKMSVRFPSTEKINIDGAAIGEGLISLLNAPYVDPDTDKEYKSMVPDNYESINDNVIPILRVIKADNKLNNRMATMTKLYFENKSLHLPIQSCILRREQEANDSNSDDVKKGGKSREMLIEELAVFVDTDSLIFECSNIVARISASGNTLFDTALSTQHKDRYSSLSMNLEYISQLEAENKAKYNSNSGTTCWGIATTF